MAGPSGVASYSTNANVNATVDGGTVTWAENQFPSTVNNGVRQNLADIRAAFNDLMWFSYGSGDQDQSGTSYLGVPYIYSSATSVQVAGGDVTAAHHAGRRMRFVGATTGIIFGTIASSTYSSGTNTSTINLVWDTTGLANEVLTGYLCQIPVTGNPLGGALTGSILGTANQITVTPAAGKVTLSLPPVVSVTGTTTGFGSGSFAAVSTNTTGVPALYVQNDAGKLFTFQMNGSAVAASGLTRPGGAMLYTDGPGGLTIQVNAAQPIYFGIQGTEIAHFDAAGNFVMQQNVAGYVQTRFTNTNAVSSSGVISSFTNDLGHGIRLIVYSSTTGAGLADASLVQGTGNGGLWLVTSTNSKIIFQVNNGNQAGFVDPADNCFKLLCNYTGGVPTQEHYIYQTTGGQGIIAFVNPVASGTIGGCQVLYTQDPNTAASHPFIFYGGYGTSYTVRFAVYSNGGVANFSANNVNLSDRAIKDHIEPLKSEIVAKLWKAHRDLPWSRYHYSDQAHDDFNWGYLAQDVAKAFADVAPELVEDFEQPEVQHPEKPGEKAKRKYLTIKGVYSEDLHNIAHAILSDAQRRIEALEEKIAKMETRH